MQNYTLRAVVFGIPKPYGILVYARIFRYWFFVLSSGWSNLTLISRQTADKPGRLLNAHIIIDIGSKNISEIGLN